MAASEAQIQDQLGQLKKVNKETNEQMIERIESNYVNVITPELTEEELIQLFATMVTEFPPITLDRYKAIQAWIETKSGKKLPEFGKYNYARKDTQKNTEFIAKIKEKEQFSDYVDFLKFKYNILNENYINNKMIPNAPNDPSFRPKVKPKVVNLTSAEKKQIAIDKKIKKALWKEKEIQNAQMDADNRAKVAPFVRLIKKYNDEFSDMISAEVVKLFVMPSVKYSQIKNAIESISDKSKKDGMLLLLETPNPKEKPFEFLKSEPAAFEDNNGCKLMNIDAGGNNYITFGKLNKTEDGRFNAKINGLILTKDIKIAKPSTSDAAFFKVNEDNTMERKNVFETTFDKMNAKRPGFNPFAAPKLASIAPAARPNFLAGKQSEAPAIPNFLAGLQDINLRPTQHGGKRTKRRCKATKRRCKTTRRKKQ